MHEKKSGLVCLTVIRVKKSSRCKTLTSTADYHHDSMMQQHTSSHTNPDPTHIIVVAVKRTFYERNLLIGVTG